VRRSPWNRVPWGRSWSVSQWCLRQVLGNHRSLYRRCFDGSMHLTLHRLGAHDTCTYDVFPDGCRAGCGAYLDHMARQLGQVGSAIAAELNPSNKTVRWWLKRLNADGLSVLMDEARS
jgi:hypothetical protein